MLMEIEKPKITCEETENGNYAKFTVEPLLEELFFLRFQAQQELQLESQVFCMNFQQFLVFMKMLLTSF